MYTLLVTGDTPGAATYFNPLLQQSIIPTLSSSRPGSPASGWHVYETDTREIRAWNGAVSSWVSTGSNHVNINTSATLKAATTNPTIGTSGQLTRTQWVRLPGNYICFSWGFQFGTVGAAAGSGQYLIDLPVAAAAGNGVNLPESTGSGMIRDASTGNVQFYVPYIAGSNLNQVTGILAGTSTFLGNATPWTWAASDYIQGTIVYQAAS